MRNISRPASSEFTPPAARFGLLISSLLLTALVVLGCWRAFAGEAPSVHTVVIEAMKYTPATVRAHAGERVVFTNRDFVPHTATAKPAGPFDSGMIKPGESWSLIVPASGSLHFSCIFHPTMEGEIIVQK